MVALDDDKALAGKVLTGVAERYHVPKQRTLSVFDDDMGNYLLMDEGWRGYKRLHHVWAHLATTDGKFYVHEDGTEEGIANRLLDAGVPKERIVLAMDAPNSRDESVSAVACVARAHQRIGVMEAKAARLNINPVGSA